MHQQLERNRTAHCHARTASHVGCFGLFRHSAQSLWLVLCDSEDGGHNPGMLSDSQGMQNVPLTQGGYDLHLLLMLTQSPGILSLL